MTTVSDLIASGERISRPCFLLRSRGAGPPAGFWGGERGDTPNTPAPEMAEVASRRHILTVDPDLLRRLGLLFREDPVSLFVTRLRDGTERLEVATSHRPGFSEISFSGVPLYASSALSFPPFAAVCLYGDEVIELWLRSLRLERHQYQEAEREPLALEYEDEFVRRSPLYTGDVDAVLGGWHMMWPEDDFFLPLEMRLLIAIYRGGEPYREIWRSPTGNIHVREHVT